VFRSASSAESAVAQQYNIKIYKLYDIYIYDIFIILLLHFLMYIKIMKPKL